MVHPVNGEVPPVKGRPRKLPHYANRGKTSSSGGELASARSCFSTVRTALGKLRITGLLAQFDIARSFPQFPRPLLLQPTILTSERGTRFGIRKAPNHVPPPHLPDDLTLFGFCGWRTWVWSPGRTLPPSSLLARSRAAWRPPPRPSTEVFFTYDPAQPPQQLKLPNRPNASTRVRCLVRPHRDEACSRKRSVRFPTDR